MVSDIVLVVDIAQGFSQKIGFAIDIESSGDIELLISSAMRTLQMSVFLVLPLEGSLMVLDQAATEAGDEFS